MVSDLEKVQLMSVLARSKGNWGDKYDRREHFKKFQNLKEIIKELSKKDWLIVHNKHKFTGISLNTQFKREIIDFIEREMPHLKSIIK
ncbi:hypothetical protein J4449_02390 [Candidatus Woesearchaeota archaeon]|nr:hypothetical protein [Candidatus Woesearchaeota archaeon]